MKYLSIVIPMYNVEKYIEKSLKSVCGLKIENEIIIVNDCSTDNSLEVVKKFKENHIDENIKIINLDTNKGAGGARNEGLINSKGKYVAFIDGDDFIEKDVFLKVVKNTMELKLDIGYTTFIENSLSSKGKHVENIKDIGIFSGEEMLVNLIKKRIYDSSICTCIYNREFLIENNLYFLEKIKGEDIEFSMKSFLLGKKVKYFKEKFYIYNHKNIESVTRNSKTKIFSYKDAIDNYFINLNIIEKLKENKNKKILQKYCFKSINAYLRELRRILSKDEFVVEVKNIIKKSKKNKKSIYFKFRFYLMLFYIRDIEKTLRKIKYKGKNQ